MGKFILTEEEKLRIKKLYENSTPPDEFEVVGYINPYKDTKYLPFAKIEYSSKLKEGDLFYFPNPVNHKKCLEEFEKKMKPDFSYLIGKTFRTSDDRIIEIKAILFSIFNFLGRTSQFLSLRSINNPDDLIQSEILISDGKSIIRQIPENLKKEIESKIPEIRAKDLPDCLFELKKVKRKKTDFKP